MISPNSTLTASNKIELDGDVEGMVHTLSVPQQPHVELNINQSAWYRGGAIYNERWWDVYDR